MLIGAALGIFAWAVSAHALGRLLEGCLSRTELLLLSFLSTVASVSVISLLLVFSGALSLVTAAGAVAASAVAIDVLVIRKVPSTVGKKREGWKVPPPLEVVPFLILIGGGVFLFFHHMTHS